MRARSSTAQPGTSGSSGGAGRSVGRPGNATIAAHQQARAAPVDPLAEFEAATAGVAGEVPYLSSMEVAFGEDFSAVEAHLGQGEALGRMGARAAASGERVAFGSAQPDRELVAHELTHVVQARQGSSGTARSDGVSHPGDADEVEAAAAADAVGRGESVDVARSSVSGLHGDWLDGALGAVGDALDMRTDEPRLDAEEDLEVFRGRSFAPLADHHPASGLGQFDVDFDPRAGTMVVTLKVAYDFVNGTPGAVSPGFRPEEFQWTPEQQAAWSARYEADVSALWSSRHVFHSTKPFWAAMVVNTTVRVVQDAADPHFRLTVAKFPDDAGMAQSSVCTPGHHHDASGMLCPANAPAADGSVPGHGTGSFDSNDMRPEQKLDWGNVSVQVPFGAGGAALDAAGTAALQPVIAQLLATPAARVELTGRASAGHRRGVAAADGAVENMDLARVRSAAVRAALIAGGVTADRILVRNAGEAAAGAGAEWRRVDVQVGTRQTQNPALHETGHMLGLDDEYPVTGAAAGTPVDPAYQAMITATTGEVLTRGRDESAMSLGSTVRPWHYSSFLEALRVVSGTQEWGL